jgi:hypothetical protein
MTPDDKKCRDKRLLIGGEMVRMISASIKIECSEMVRSLKLLQKQGVTLLDIISYLERSLEE